MSMKSSILSFLFLWYIYVGHSQCTYQAYESFSYSSNIPLHNLSGGTGWQTPWYVQNKNSTVPGFQSAIGNLPHSDLQNLGGRGTGGFAYLTMSRTLNTTRPCPFDSLVSVNGNGIGTMVGDTLWVSTLLRKELNNDQRISF
ncbi:MAG: hypothetical protein WAU01_03905, partial [Saprospiraceae bacterium]